MSVHSPEMSKVEGKQSQSATAQELNHIAAETNRRIEAWGGYRAQTDPSSGFVEAEAKRIQDAREDHGRPHVDRYTTDQGNEVNVIGSINSYVDEHGEVEILGGHPTAPNSPVVEVMRDGLQHAVERSKEGKKVTVIYEGSFVPRPEFSEDDTMAKGHESALLAKLGQEAGLDIVSGEPTGEELRLGFAERRADLEAQGISEDTILAQRVLSGLPDAARSGDLAEYLFSRATEVGLPGFTDPTPEERTVIESGGDAAVSEYLQQRRGKGVQLVARLNAVIQSETGIADAFAVSANGEVALGPSMGDPNTDDLYVQVQGMVEGENNLRRVREVKSEIRDKVIFERVADASKQGDVFVVYGGSHISSLQPVFESYFGETRPAS